MENVMQDIFENVVLCIFLSNLSIPKYFEHSDVVASVKMFQQLYYLSNCQILFHFHIIILFLNTRYAHFNRFSSELVLLITLLSLWGRYRPLIM